MIKLEVFDPPMCCSTGVCGPSVDDKLVRFAADLDWIGGQEVNITRYNLSQQPGEFAGNSLVKDALTREGNDCLPLILVDGVIARKGTYPSRNELSEIVGIPATLATDQVLELVAIGAAIASNCEACFKYHFDKARKLGVTTADMLQAVRMAQMVKNSPAKSISELAAKYLGDKEANAKSDSGCGSGGCC